MTKYDFIDFTKEQHEDVEYIKEKKKCGLFLPMGTGKTVISLTAIKELLDDKKIKKALVVAPLRVCNTVWKQEAEEWEHLSKLSIGICTGSNSNRMKELKKDYEIHVINRENVPWLISCILEKELKWKWDMLIVDESSSFKNPSSQRFRAIRKVLKFLNYVVLLTGTPSPNGYMDLWSQIFLIDQGERLGRGITLYRRTFFDVDYSGYVYTLKEGADERIKEKISDICRTRTGKTGKGKVDIFVKVELPKDVREFYKELEKEFLALLEGGGNIEAPNAAALGVKLLQTCNGAVYDESQKIHKLHDEKIKALKDIIEDNGDENILVAYNFKHDLLRLREAFPEAIELSKNGKEITPWNEGKIKILLAHPASAGHGLNIQFGGSVIVWFGFNWSLELYQQFNARLDRQGQKELVRVIHIVAENTIDKRVLAALKNKAETQNELLNYLRKGLLNDKK